MNANGSVKSRTEISSFSGGLFLSDNDVFGTSVARLGDSKMLRPGHLVVAISSVRRAQSHCLIGSLNLIVVPGRNFFSSGSWLIPLSLAPFLRPTNRAILKII
jgi:hypothetical protein